MPTKPMKVLYEPCPGGKQTHPTLKEALKTLRRVGYQRYLNYQKGEKRAYYCWECKGYHLTKLKVTYIREAHIAHKGIFITLSTGIKKFVELPVSVRISEEMDNYHLSGLLVMWPGLDLIMDHKGNFFNGEGLYDDTNK